MKIDTQWPEWTWKVRDEAWEIAASDGEPLVTWKQGAPLLPATGYGKPRVLKVESRPHGEHAGEIVTTVAPGHEFSEVRLAWAQKGNHVEWRATFVAGTDGVLHDWDVLPVGARLNLYDLLHIRNRHRSPKIVERYGIGGHLTGGEAGEGGVTGGFRTSTDSRDWQFAPNPSYYVFAKNELHLFLGTKDIPQGFGFVLEIEKGIVKSCRLDYGAGIFHFKKGETVQSPVFCLFVNRGRDYWDTVDQWVDLLIAEKWIPDPAARTFSEAMLKPCLGTWTDQVFRGRVKGETGMVWGWGDESDEQFGRVQSVCCDKFIRAEVAQMEKHGLPFGTIGIDDRWFRWRGDFDLHEGRFPDMRGLVDWLHSRGLKVLLWLPPFDVEPQAKMNQKREWLAGGGARNQEDRAFLDYSNPEVREKWLLPKLRLWLSDAPGCWNADGFKLDFMADKVPRHIPLCDRSWQGEEMFIWRWHQFVYESMKAIKPDSIMLGCAPHPHFAQFQDWVRTYDVHDSDYRQHGTRGLRIRHLTPGTILSYDYHTTKERLAGYLEQALADHAHLEIGAIFGMDEELGPKELALIKECLLKSKPVPGLRLSPALEAQFRRWSL